MFLCSETELWVSQKLKPTSTVSSSQSKTSHTGVAIHRLRTADMPEPDGRSRAGVSVDADFPGEPEQETQRLLLAANECIKNSEFADAERLYVDALALETSEEMRATLLSNLCSALAHQQRWDDALVLAQECVELRPTWPRSHWCEGSALEGVGQHSAALAAYKRAAQLDPCDPEFAAAVAEMEEMAPALRSFGDVSFTFSLEAGGRPVVTRVRRGSKAALAGVEVADAILEIDRVNVEAATEDEIASRLGGVLGAPVELVLARRGTIGLPLVVDRDIVKEQSCGYGCGYSSSSVLQLEAHEGEDCTLKHRTSNSPIRQQKGATLWSRTSPLAIHAAYQAFQNPIEALRRDLPAIGRMHAISPSRAGSLDPRHRLAPAESSGWQFQVLGSGKIAGKYRRRDCVVCMVNCEGGAGRVALGDIGVVCGEGRSGDRVRVRFELSEVDLCGETEVRKCLYQDIESYPERQKVRELVARLAAAEQRAIEQLELAEHERALNRERLQAMQATHEIGRVGSLTVPMARKPSFVQRVMRSISVRT